MIENPIKSLIVILITLIVGPLIFYILSKKYTKNNKLKKFPVGLIDGWGDIIFLPIFNAIAIENISAIKISTMFISIFLGLSLTIIFINWRKNNAHHNDWSRPRKYSFNNGGWYHATYMFFQASFIFYIIILEYNRLQIWIPIIGYLSLVIIRLIQVHEKIDET